MDKSNIVILLFSVALFSCHPKTIDPYFGSYVQNIDSKLLNLERVAVSIKEVAVISGAIYGKENINTSYQDPLVDAVIIVIDQQSGKLYANLTDTNGKYQIDLPASIYKLKVEYTHFQTLIVRDLAIQAGDIIKLVAELGITVSEGDSAVYEMRLGKPIKLAKP